MIAIDMRIGLRQRYALIIAMSAVAVASAVQVVSYWESKRLAEEVERSSSQSMSRALRREADLAARQLVSVLKDSLVEPLVEEDFERIFNITHSARSLPDVKHVLVYDHDGRVIHDGTKEIASYGARAPDGLRTLVLEQGQTLTKFGEETLDVCAPIRTEARVLGAIRFSLSLTRFVEHGLQLNQELAAINQESADKHLRNFVGLIVPLFLLGTAVGIFFAGRLIEPIQGLMAMTRRIAQRDFAVDVSERRSDEFGELASSLRHMAAEIEESMISRSLLEKKVQERTLALQEANRQLEQRDHHRRRFLAEASHELRTPLTIIHGEAQVTARQKHDDVAHYQECLTTITEQTTAMCTLVDDLLKLARLDHHLTEYSFERVQVADIIESAEKAARKLTKPKDLQITSESKQADITIFGDRQKLRQLMMIFIKNSINYSPKGGTIDIRSHARDGAAEILISDQGIGLEPLDQIRIFDPFYRGREARQLDPNGSGLGLPIAKTISDAHRGVIRVSGRAVGGTTVSIKLPLEGCDRCRD